MKSIFDHARTFNEPDLLLAMEAAQGAGDIIREGYAKSVTITEKGMGDLVSVIDKTADVFITDTIRKVCPDDQFLTEELLPDTIEDPKRRMWVVDPLDGTSAFLFHSGRHLPSVMIALRKNMRDNLAVLHFPLVGDQGEWFYAVRGKGAFKDGALLSTAPLHTTLNTAWVEINQHSDASRETPQFRMLREKLRSKNGARLVTTQAPHSGIAMRILDQTQRIDAVVHDNGKMKQGPWDVIPPRTIVEEAGGCVVNLKGGPYDPFRPEPFIVAGKREIANQILALLAA